MAGDRKYCSGCRDDHYNCPGNSMSGECWNLETAEVVTRFRIGWWTAPTEPGAFVEVVTHSCHNEPGKFGFYQKVPDFAKDVRRLVARP